MNSLNLGVSPFHNEILMERGEGISDLVFLVDDLEVEKNKLLNRGTTPFGFE
ncbi:MAG: hypothetical protein Ct9H90mP4_12570 [Gammaproteobacteria bacterium]|nr:MAG: hypothetical protein Ct9H90mP4_12570 [Gammaproteobacteria bacterium]